MIFNKLVMYQGKYYQPGSACPAELVERMLERGHLLQGNKVEQSTETEEKKRGRGRPKK